MHNDNEDEESKNDHDDQGIETWSLEHSNFALTDAKIIQCLKNFYELSLSADEHDEAQTQAFLYASEELNEMILAVLNIPNGLVTHNTDEDPEELANLFLRKLNFGFENEEDQNLFAKTVKGSETIQSRVLTGLLGILREEDAESANALEQSLESLSGDIPTELREEIVSAGAEDLMSLLEDYFKDNINKAHNRHTTRRSPSIG